MAKMENRNKEKIISEFEMMKEFELSVKALYIKIINSPDVKEQKIKDILTKIADDEQRHSELVQKIIDIATDAL